MDNLKQYLAVLKKHHFWVLCGVLVLVASYAWWSGTTTFNAQFASQQGKLENTFRQLGTVRQETRNESFVELAQQLHGALEQQTGAAWRTLYEQQREHLTWPEGTERIGELAWDDLNIDESLLRLFADVDHGFLKQLHALPQIVDATRQETVDGKSVKRGMVDWPGGAVDTLAARYRWPSIPRPLQVRYAQEDYWVYRSVLETIAGLNASVGAQHQRNAVVKRIDELHLAQVAISAPPPNLEQFVDKTLVFEAPNKPKPPGTNADDKELKDGRYVNLEFLPISDPAQSPVKEYRLLPVRLMLTMDQRKLPDLLAACANSWLPLEVYHVRVIETGGHKQVRRPTQSGSGGSSAAAAGGIDLHPFDGKVEIRGVVYLFNTPPQTAAESADAVAAAR